MLAFSKCPFVTVQRTVVADETEDEEEEAAPKTKKETQWGWELLNDNKAIWLRSANDVDEEEYDKFFQAVSKVLLQHATFDEHVHYVCCKSEPGTTVSPQLCCRHL